MQGKRFPSYGHAGWVLIALAETFIVVDRVTGVDLSALTTWTTPVCWWGYILLVDACIFRLKGESLVRSRPKELAFQFPISVLLWLIFEAYNLHLRNWRYVPVPGNLLVLGAGAIISFGSILPALLETSELLETMGAFGQMRVVRLQVRGWMIYGSLALGLVLCIAPLLVSEDRARYLFALVWMGFIFLLDPIVYSSGGPSLLGDLEKGSLTRILSLASSGYVCGFLWEFWNYWAAAKWQYLVPFTPQIRIFEMPMAGFLGFGPFAWEFFCMYQFVRLMGKGKMD